MKKRTRCEKREKGGGGGVVSRAILFLMFGSARSW